MNCYCTFSTGRLRGFRSGFPYNAKDSYVIETHLEWIREQEDRADLAYSHERERADESHRDAQHFREEYKEIGGLHSYKTLGLQLPK